MHDSTAGLRRAARERADEQGRRIPWQRLYKVRNQYVDWQESYLWVRSILEAEPGISNWLGETLSTRCPQFLESESAQQSRMLGRGSYAFARWPISNLYGEDKAIGRHDAGELLTVKSAV